MAVYTHISPQDITQHLAHFDIGTLISSTGISEGVSNTNYKITTTAGTYILTLFEGWTDVESLPFHLNYMTHLQQNGIPCADIIRDKSDESIVSIRGKPALITSFLQGASVKDIQVLHAAAAGALLAKMHLAAASFSQQRPNAMSLPAWRKLVDHCKTHKLYAALQDELDFQERNWPQSLPSGAVHADLFPDNVFFSDDQVSGVIDFYFSCTDAFAYDLMLTLNAWCFNAEGLHEADKSAAFLQAYQEIRPLNAAEKKSLPFFGRAAALRIISTRLYAWINPSPDAIVTPKDPLVYVNILKQYQKRGIPL